MSARAKRKPKAIPAGMNDPTPERMLRDAFDIVPAPRMEGEHIGRDKLASTRRQASRVRRMEAGHDPWINRAEAVALEHYELLTEQAGYGGTRSCMDMSPRGGGGPEGVIDRLEAARRLLARARNSVGDQVALIFVDAVLAPYGGETLDDVMMQMIGGGRAVRSDAARSYVTTVAGALMLHFSA